MASSSSSATAASSTVQVRPVLHPHPFPTPVLYPARRCHGFVETPAQRPPTDQRPTTTASTTTTTTDPPLLKRQPSVAGNVLLLELPPAEGATPAFLLQRKVGTTTYGGSVRVGFRLRDDKPADDGLWHVQYYQPSSNKNRPTSEEMTQPSANGSGDTTTTNRKKRDHTQMEDIPEQCEMVTVYIEHDPSGSKKDDAQSRNIPGTTGTDNLYTELAALQYIAQQSTSTGTSTVFRHLWGTNDMGKDVDSGWVCAVLPKWHSDGSLLDYCTTSQPTGTLPVEEAKFYFRQIVAGLQELQAVGMCHRSISLETILLEGKHITLTHYGNALRIPKPSSIDNDTKETPTAVLMSPQTVCGRFPESVAPELWDEQPFDGYAVDLWSAGIALWQMTVHQVPLFAAPIPDDFRFREYCLEGKMKEALQPAALPDALVDLLVGLLRAKPADRYTLKDVLNHPWLVAES